jgi:dTDP-4-dehydrorhamnose 3,5-epimerase
MRVEPAPLDGVLVVHLDVFQDDRGFFMETYREARYQEHGIPTRFVQDNLSLSKQGTLRGLHFQHPQPQAKLIQAIQGEIYDVCVDIRTGSPSFGRWFGLRLTADEPVQLFLPEGFAHGFCALSDEAVVLYKCSRAYAQDYDAGILWSDPDIGIAWPVEDPLLSPKDRTLPRLGDIPRDRLPGYGEDPS